MRFFSMVLVVLRSFVIEIWVQTGGFNRIHLLWNSISKYFLKYDIQVRTLLISLEYAMDEKIH